MKQSSYYYNWPLKMTILSSQDVKNLGRQNYNIGAKFLCPSTATLNVTFLKRVNSLITEEDTNEIRRDM